MAKRGGFSENLRSSLEPSFEKPALPRTTVHHPQSSSHTAHEQHRPSHIIPPLSHQSTHQRIEGERNIVSDKTTVHNEHQAEHQHSDEQQARAHAAHHAHHRRKRFEIFAAIFLALLLFAVMFIAMSADSSPFIVLIAFTPTLFTVVIAMVVYEAHKDNKHILWGLPLVFSFAFYWLASNAHGIIAGIDVEVLTAMNVLFSFFYLIVNYFLLQKPAPKMRSEVRVVVKEREVEVEVIPEDLSKFIASIEDKGKALNFAIGRVYNAYHGGTKELRQKINIKQEWYDEFSQIPSDPKKIDLVSLSALISTIEARLRLLEKTEVEIFGSAHKSFKNLVRSNAGTDKVMDVLDKNDKDPVKSYVEGALEFCGKVKDYLSKNKAPEVKNEYVERPEEEKRKNPAPRSSTWNNLKLK